MNMSSLVISSGQTTAQVRHLVHSRGQADSQLQGNSTHLGVLASAAGDPFRGQTTVNELQQTFHRVSA